MSFPSLSHSLEVELEGELVFFSDARWLHPLFELEEFLAQANLSRSDILVRDRIVGRAAALLLVRLGIRHVETGLVSRPGQEVLEGAGVRLHFREVVDRIGCRTETLLLRVDDPEEAYRMVRELLSGAL